MPKLKAKPKAAPKQAPPAPVDNSTALVADAKHGHTIVNLPIDKVHPNSYNPNVMLN